MFDLKSVGFIQTFLDRLSPKQVLYWLVMIPLLFQDPRKFFSNYYAQKAEERLGQILIYSAILVLSLLILMPGTYINLFKILLTGLFFSVALSIILSFIARILKVKRRNFLDILAYSYILSLYGLFFSFTFIIIFIKNEDYSFMFISHIFSNAFILAAIFGYWLIIKLKAIKVIYALLLTILIINVGMVALSLLSIDRSNDSPEMDPFIAEIEYYSDGLKEMGGIPYSRSITFERGIGTYDSLSIMNPARDTLTHYDQKGVDLFRNIAKVNVKKIDSIRSKLNFKKTKKLFDDLRNYFFLVGDMFDYPPCDTCFISGYNIKLKDGTLLKDSRKYIIDSAYLKDRIIFDKKISEIYELKEKSESPAIVLYLITYPYYFIGEKLDKKTTRKNIRF